MSYDRKCFELAQSFMSDNPHITCQLRRTQEMAQEIQTLIEDCIKDYEDADRLVTAKAEQEAEEGLPEHKRSGYAERMAEHADMERKRRIEEVCRPGMRAPVDGAD